MEDRKDAELIDEIGREEDIQPIRIVCIPFDNQVLLEEIRILDNPRKLELPIERHQLAADHRRRHDRLSGAVASSVRSRACGARTWS